MCFPADASPPVPEIRGASVEHRNLTLTAADGNTLMAFEAVGENPGSAAVVVLPDVRGLYSFYEELALRFAQHGYDSVAIDYFGRSAGTGSRNDEFDYMPHVRQTTVDGVQLDVAAAVSQLKTSNPERPIFTVGFCFGGSNSWRQAASGHDLAGAIGFYGNPGRPDVPQGSLPVVNQVGDMTCPVLGLMGGADQGIPESLIARFRDALASAGVEGEIVTYPGAPHSFFDRTYEQYATESADAWQRVLAFIENNS